MLHTAIHLTYPTLTGSEARYMQSVLESRQWGGDGVFGRRVESLLTEDAGAASTLLTTSCTHALEMCALLLDLAEGDEVIVPSFTFVSTANAFVLHGARPVFADVSPDTLNIDPASVERLVGPRTRAIVAVHYAGVGCDMQELSRIAQAHGLMLIEDNAHGLFGRYDGRPLGSFGALTGLSFHATKNFSCGEGGALVINDARLVQRAEIIREKGTDRTRFRSGLVDKYTWRDTGSSYVLSDILAACLLAQLEHRDSILQRRREAWQYYHRELATWADEFGIRQPVVPAHCESAWHLYHLQLPAPADQAAFIEHMRANEVACAFHYVPLNVTPQGRSLGGVPGSCPVAESAALRLVRLPLHAELAEKDLERVVAVARKWRPARSGRTRTACASSF